MINRKYKKILIIFTLFNICINLCLNTSSSIFLNTQFISKNTYNPDSNKIKSSNLSYIDNNEHKIFWFIQITDTQFVWSANESIANFYQLLNETFHQINPLFIYNTGDLVDANNGALQDIDEWSLYRKALEDNNMNSSIYIDLIGNHDASNDFDFSYYLNYSMIGSTFNTLQYSFNKTFSFGNYAFIGLNTAKSSYNLIEFAFLGFLNTTELDWYEKELYHYRNFDKIFVFGHHPHKYPPTFTIASDLSSSGKTFSDLNTEFNVNYYLSGHVHVDSFQNENNFLAITTSNFNLNGGTYRIIALDHNQLSTSIETVGSWPQAIITYPSSESALIQNINKIRILAWDPHGINSVEYSLHSNKKEFQITNWEPLTNINSNGPLWEKDLDIQLNGKYILKVKVEGGSGQVIKEIYFTSNTGWGYEFTILFIFTIITLISISIIILNYSRDHIDKFKKKAINLYREK
ncbi:MAG: metallophosphoesterase family protein [Candidatus Hodarchaeota archaeon]